MDLQNQLKLSRNVAVTAGIFCLVVAMLLLLNYLQLSKKDPLENEAIKVLVQRLSEDPDNDALKNDIRNLDLLARKAYFNSRWQVKTGGYLLLFGAILTALALRIYYSLKSKIEIPEMTPENEFQSRLLSQKWILGTGAGLILLALLAGYLSVDHLDSFKVVDSSAEAVKEGVDPGIEVIEVAEAPTMESQPADTAALPAGTAAELPPPTTAVTTAVTADTVKNPVAPAFPDLSQIRANYPSFRGPMGNGVSGHKNIPVEFDGSAGTNILWKVGVPLPGNNSPVIWGDKLFLSGADASKREIFCYDRYGGKLQWRVSAENIGGTPATTPKTTDDTGLAAPSVAADGIHVYAIFANGDVMAADMNGKRIWGRNLGLPDNHYGHASSLITWKNLLYVQYDTNKSRKLIALDVMTGQTVWETNRNVKISWASPVLANIGGRVQVLLSSDPLVAGYDAVTGKELWSADCMMGEVGPSPAFGEGLVFAANEYARVAAINPAGGQIVWEQDEYMPEVASPVVAGGLLFIATSYGILVCYDAKTGDKLWEFDGGVGYYSSPVVADEKLFIFNLEGLLQVYALSREKTLLAESPLGVQVHTTPAFASKRIYVRTKGSLYCIGSK